MRIYRKLKREDELEFFTQFEGVVFGVLKRMTINQHHPDYDDLAQIGRLKLVHAYENYPEDPWSEETRGRFIGFAFTKIRWGIIDAIRKRNAREEKEQVWDETFNTILAVQDGAMSETLFEKDWLEEVLQPLNDKEKRLVICICIDQMTITDIAKKEGVSRKTIYQRRKSVKNKLQHTLYKEKGAEYEDTNY